ncbi:hypothetical protein DNTS_003951 [Danionella cerebrum]|uniref:Uncharacterized protein n=1 Tax=Danionella cerebrum TaxID=2873325 RepID=A0A553Q1G0_9TELE|nr:hypothetical protein DNTS_003951 [Danionella translucida]
MDRSERIRDMLFAVRVAAKLAETRMEDHAVQSVIDNFIWNLSEKDLEVLQTDLSYQFSKRELCQMLTAIADSAFTTAAELLPKLSEMTATDPSDIMHLRRAPPPSSTEDVDEESSADTDLFAVDKLQFSYPLERYFGITEDQILADCGSDDTFRQLFNSDVAGVIVEEVVRKVNSVMVNNVHKLFFDSHPVLVYFTPNGSCSNIGKMLITRVLEKCNFFQRVLSWPKAVIAIGTSLEAILKRVPETSKQGSRQQMMEAVLRNLLEYIIDDFVEACPQKPRRSVPHLKPIFECYEERLALVLQEEDQPSCSNGPSMTPLLNPLMMALYQSKFSGQLSSQENTSAVSDRLHQLLGELMNCLFRRDAMTQQKLTESARDFMHRLVKELVQRLFLSSTFPCPSTLTVNNPVMPCNLEKEDCGLTAVDLLTDLVLRHVENIQLEKFSVKDEVEAETEFKEVSVQADPPKLTFREKAKMLKSNILQKLKKPKKKNEKNKGAEGERDEKAPKPKSSFFCKLKKASKTSPM